MSGIAVVGSNMVDLITYVDRMPELGETLTAPRFATGHGGKGANQAVAAAKLGSKVLMVTKVGDDDFGHATLRNLEMIGIDTRYSGYAAGVASGVAPIFVEPDGTNRILIVKGANEHLRPADVEQAAGDLADCGLILLQLEVPLETIYFTVELARKIGVPAMLNAAPAIDALLLDRLTGLGFLVVNETELAQLSGHPVDRQDDVAQAAQILLDKGIGCVIATLGKRGAALFRAGLVIRVEAPAVKVVDTTGAGDAFIGAFAHFYVQGLEDRIALERAAAYAAASVTRPGTQSAYATAEEFLTFMGHQSET